MKYYKKIVLGEEIDTTITNDTLPPPIKNLDLKILTSLVLYTIIYIKRLSIMSTSKFLLDIYHLEKYFIVHSAEGY